MRKPIIAGNWKMNKTPAEASALVNLCNIYKIRNTVVLMVSDRHPLSENDPVWEWGSVNFGDMAVRFIQDCVEYALKAVKK